MRNFINKPYSKYICNHFISFQLSYMLDPFSNTNAINERNKMLLTLNPNPMIFKVNKKHP